MIRRLLTGLGGLVLLAAALVGLPVFLLAAHTGLADQLPTLAEVPDALLGPGDGGLFLLLLFAVGWVCWAVFVLAFLTEVVARVRGVQAPHLGPFIPQATAARAVSAVLLLVTLAPAVTVPAAVSAAPADRSASSTSVPAAVAPPATPMRAHTPPPSTAAVTPAAHPDAAAAARSAEGPEQPQTEAVQDYTVVRGDTLWEIADDRLDDPTRYPEIVQASEDITQPDGRHLSDPDLILPGWTLNVPAQDTEPARAATQSDEPPAEAGAPEAASPEVAEDSPGEQVVPPRTPLSAPPPSAAGPSGVSPAHAAAADTPRAAAAVPVTPMRGTTTPATDDLPVVAAAAREAVYDDEGRFAPTHGVLGLPEWITAPLIPTRPEDAPELVAEAHAILARHAAQVAAARAAGDHPTTGQAKAT